MGELKLSQVVKYGAVLGIGMSVATAIKPVTAGIVCALVKHYFPDMYKECEREVIEKRRARES